jgi:hypothetical protein
VTAGAGPPGDATLEAVAINLDVRVAVLLLPMSARAGAA